MPKPVKWVLIAGTALVLLIIAAIVIIPFFIDVNKYKPQLEAMTSKQIGRPLVLGGDLKPSVFPWIGIGIRDVRLGNTPAFAEKDFVAVDEIEVRVKLLPILSGRYEIKRFVIKGARIALIKNKDGQLNTQGIGPSNERPVQVPTPPAPKPEAEGDSALPVKDFMAQEIALKDCSVSWIDHTTGLSKEITAINLVLSDVSLVTPIRLDFSAVADGRPVALQGAIGPLGIKPGKDPLNLDLTARLLETLVLHLKGRLENATQTPTLNLAVAIDPFSPRDLLTRLNQPLPFEPADKSVLQNLSLGFNIAATPEKMDLTKGVLHLDQTKMEFNAQAKELAKPNLLLSAMLDELDLDRYLPPPKQDQTDKKEKPAQKTAEKTDYAPLRKLVLDASIQAGALKIKNSRMENIRIKATARNGIFKLDPLDMALFKGKLAATGKLDVRRDEPTTELSLDLGGIQAGPLMKNFLNKELIQGALKEAGVLKFNGDQVDLIRKTLDGKGELKFNDGAIVGVDLADMVRNVQSAFSLAEKPTEKPRTDFSELMVAFALNQGLMKLDSTKLNSPLIRLVADGNVDLSKETLDLRINPKFVATLVGQGDKSQRSGVAVPVLVKGTLQKPKFEPDLKGLLSQPLPGTEKISKDLDQTKKNINQEVEENKKKITEDLEKKTQKLLKGLPFGNKQ